MFVDIYSTRSDINQKITRFNFVYSDKFDEILLDTSINKVILDIYELTELFFDKLIGKKFEFSDLKEDLMKKIDREYLLLHLKQNQKDNILYQFG